MLAGSQEYLGNGSGTSRGTVPATSSPPGSGLRRSPWPSARPWLADIDRAPKTERGGGGVSERSGAQGLGNPAFGVRQHPNVKTGGPRSRCVWVRVARQHPRGTGGSQGGCFPIRLQSPWPSPTSTPAPRFLPRAFTGAWAPRCELLPGQGLRGCGRGSH